MQNDSHPYPIPNPKEKREKTSFWMTYIPPKIGVFCDPAVDYGPTDILEEPYNNGPHKE